jgi:hypothetical protein
VIAEKRSKEECNTLRNILVGVREELDLTKEKIMHLQKNEAIIDVYKKKIETLA